MRNIKGSKIIKKLLLVLVVVAALAVLAVSVASADPSEGQGPPEGVTFAIREDTASCSLSHLPGSYYEGEGFVQWSNSATGQFTWQCKFELVSGIPQYDTRRWTSFGCDNKLAVAGVTGMWITQCEGVWYPDFPWG